MMIRISGKRDGFTMLELIIVCGIVIIALVGLLATYISCLELTESTKNSQIALLEVEHYFELIRNSDFPSVYTSYNGYNFHVPQMFPLDNIGHVTVDNTADPYLVTIGVCWRQKSGRIYGACHDNAGTLALDNSTGVLESPVQIASLVTQR